MSTMLKQAGLAMALAAAMATTSGAQAQGKDPKQTQSRKSAKKAPSQATPAAEEKDSTMAEIEKYREMLKDGNPAEFYEMRGEDLWKNPGGPNKVSLAEKCDLGLGPGVVKGAYVQTPRYFADADRVMDMESRLVFCMTRLQGIPEAGIAKNPFGNSDKSTDILDLVAYVASQSAGMKLNVPTQHPKEKAAYELGKQIFSLRGGPYDFACATCHGEGGKRIRLQDLPKLADPKDARQAYIGWPGYRVSTSHLHSMQWRINDCFRQQRFPEPRYTSESVNALITYLAVTANGVAYPGIAMKR